LLRNDQFRPKPLVAEKLRYRKLISREQLKSGQYLDLDRMPGTFRFMDKCFKATDNLLGTF
jgi:hypothetical protein